MATFRRTMDVFGRDPRPVATAVLAALGAGLALAVPGRAAAAACAPQGLGITPLQTNVFYIDTTTNYLGSYVGYRVSNLGGAARDDLWQRLEAFTGGVVAPAAGGATTAASPVPAIAPGASAPTYAYLRAPAATSATQRHDVVLYRGRPGAGGVEVCRETQTIAGVFDVIKAAANKVTGATGPSSATLGGTFDLTVTGSTGTVGAGPATDPGIIRFSPAVAADWPWSSFRLVGVSHRIPTASAPVQDVLARPSMSGADRDYSITYTFRVVGPTSTATPIIPVQNIASGTQVKHTDPGTVGALAPIPVVTSTVTMGLAAGTGGPYAPGEHVGLTARAVNTGSRPVGLDEVVVRLPAGWSYRAGTATIANAPVPDPHAATATELRFVGPFTVPAQGDLALGLGVTAGTAGSSGAVTAVGTLAGGQIDSTLAPGDDAPARLDVAVIAPPVATDDTLDAASGHASSLDVLRNDALNNGTPSIAITSSPSHGTAVVAGDRISYTSDAGYTGPDGLSYSVTTAGGTSVATASITVGALPAAPAPPPLASTGVGTAAQHAVATVPGGGGVTLVDGGSRVLSVTVPSVGGYAVDPATGEITFSPVYGYAGTPAGVAYEVTDAFGQTGSSRYVPQVTAPAPPAPADAASAGVGTLTTRVTLQIPPSGSITLLDGHGDPVAGLAVDGVGTYALDPSTGVLSFTAVPGYTGSPPAVRYRVTDAYGQRATAGYTPTITAPEGPAAGDVLTSGAHAAAQHRTVPVPQGGTVLLLAGGVPAATLTVPGEGVYTASPLTGELTFAPEPGFHGAAAGVGYIVTDAYGQTATARFIPTVAAPPAKDGADPSPGPIAEPVPAPPAPGPALRVAPLLRPSADGTVVPVTCTLPGGRLDGCRVTLTGRIGHRTVVVGRAGVSLPEGRTADRVTVWVPLTPDGRSRARRGGGLRITARAVVRSGPVVLATAPRRARIAAEVPRIGVRPVLFSTDSAAIGPADAAYLRRLHRRLRDAGVRGVVCQGRADARSGPAHNRALGQARARAVCARLVRRTHLWSTTVVSLGEGRPVATNATASGMRLNRRTDIRLIW